MVWGKIASRTATPVATASKGIWRAGAVPAVKPPNLQRQNNNAAISLRKKLKILKEDPYFQTTDEFKKLTKYTDSEIIRTLRGKAHNENLKRLLGELDLNIKISPIVSMASSASSTGSMPNINMAELDALWQQASSTRAKATRLLDDFLFPLSKHPKVIRMESQLGEMGVNARLCDSRADGEHILAAFKDMRNRGVPLPKNIRMRAGSSGGEAGEALASKTDKSCNYVFFVKDGIKNAKPPAMECITPEIREKASNNFLMMLLGVETKGTRRDILKHMSTLNDRHIPYHEVQHIINPVNISATALKKITGGEFPKNFTKNLPRIKHEVSYYGSTSPDEFRSEVFAGLMGGKKYSRPIMDLFKELGGIVPR